MHGTMQEKAHFKILKNQTLYTLYNVLGLRGLLIGPYSFTINHYNT